MTPLDRINAKLAEGETVDSPGDTLAFMRQIQQSAKRAAIFREALRMAVAQLDEETLARIADILDA